MSQIKNPFGVRVKKKNLWRGQELLGNYLER
jgi:hypothetical protein